MQSVSSSNHMKNFRQWVAIIVGMMALTGSLKAQWPMRHVPDSMLLNPIYDIETLLPSFDSLYEIAKANNPTVKQEAASMRSAQWTVNYTRWIWAQNVSVFYNYNVGSLPIFAYTDFQLQRLIQVKEGWRGGVMVQLSIFDVLGQRGRINEQKEKVIFQKYKRDAEALELRRKLGQFWADVVGYNRLYKGRNEDLLTQTIACSIAEKEFREGAIHISEYSRQKNVMADAEAAFQESFRFYYSSLLQFEAIMGVPLESIMIKPKPKK